MIQEEIFNSLLETIETNKKAKEEGKVTSLLFPFERLSQKFPGWERGHYYCITAVLLYLLYRILYVKRK
jgi:hypothetical protein